MPTGSVKFQIQDLKELLTHYTEGEIPMEAEAVNFGQSPVLPGWWGLVCHIPHPLKDVNEILPGMYAYHFRYEGNKILQFKGKDQEAEYQDVKDAF